MPFAPAFIALVITGAASVEGMALLLVRGTPADYTIVAVGINVSAIWHLVWKAPSEERARKLVALARADISGMGRCSVCGKKRAHRSPTCPRCGAPEHTELYRAKSAAPPYRYY